MWKKILISLLAILGFGFIRLPLQDYILQQEKEADLLIDSPNLSVSDALEQQFSIASLGGLRPLIAAMLSMDAFDGFLRSDWVHLEKRYKQVTALAPHTDFYWDNGSWHLGVNAASSILENRRLSPLERREGSMKYIKKGRDFLQQGIRMNPKNGHLHALMGDMYADIYRHPDFGKAADEYKKARILGSTQLIARKEFYALARTPSRAAEAYALGKELFQNPINRVPSLVSNLFALENKLKLPEDQRIPFRELFGDDQTALELLESHLGNTLRYPTDGIRQELDRLNQSIRSSIK